MPHLHFPPALVTQHLAPFSLFFLTSTGNKRGGQEGGRVGTWGQIWPTMPIPHCHLVLALKGLRTMSKNRETARLQGQHAHDKQRTLRLNELDAPALSHAAIILYYRSETSAPNTSMRVLLQPLSAQTGLTFCEFLSNLHVSIILAMCPQKQWKISRTSFSHRNQAVTGSRILQRKQAHVLRSSRSGFGIDNLLPTYIMTILGRLRYCTLCFCCERNPMRHI